MAEPAAIPLAQMGKGIVGADGDIVGFEFIAQSGEAFRFSCPHEAVSEIVQNLVALADVARQRRGEPDTGPTPGLELTERARALKGWTIGLSADLKEAVLMLRSESAFSISFALPLDDVEKLYLQLWNTVREAEKRKKQKGH